MIVAEGHQQMEDVGFAHFSAREVAKRIGYSIGTVYNVFGNYDRLILAINGHTLREWTAQLRERLGEAGRDRLEILVRSYFEYANAHRNAWAAIYDHRLPPDEAMPPWYAALLEDLIGLVVNEVAAALPEDAQAHAPALARSLLASVHGHCVFAMNGTFALLGEAAPVDAAVTLVKQAVATAADG